MSNAEIQSMFDQILKNQRAILKSLKAPKEPEVHRHLSPETRAKMSEAAKRRWARNGEKEAA